MERVAEALEILDEVLRNQSSYEDCDKTVSFVDLGEVSMMLSKCIAPQELEDTDGTLYITASMGGSSLDDLYVSAVGGSILEESMRPGGPLTSSPVPLRRNALARIVESPGVVNLELSVITGVRGARRNLSAELSVLQENDDDDVLGETEVAVVEEGERNAEISRDERGDGTTNDDAIEKYSVEKLIERIKKEFTPTGEEVATISEESLERL